MSHLRTWTTAHRFQPAWNELLLNHLPLLESNGLESKGSFRATDIHMSSLPYRLAALTCNLVEGAADLHVEGLTLDE